MEELERLCKEQGLSFILDYNNHKRLGFSVYQYADQFFGDGFSDEEGQKWLAAMDRRDTIVSISVFDKQMKAGFRNYDCDLQNCIADSIRSINDGMHKVEYSKVFDYSPPPLD